MRFLYWSGLFLDLFEMLEPRGVCLPSQLLNSGHLAKQRERQLEKEGGRERERGGGRGTRRRKKSHQRDFYHQ